MNTRHYNNKTQPCINVKCYDFPSSTDIKKIERFASIDEKKLDSWIESIYETACEVFWNYSSQDNFNSIFGVGIGEIYSAGNSNGWLIVDGIKFDHDDDYYDGEDESGNDVYDETSYSDFLEKWDSFEESIKESVKWYSSIDYVCKALDNLIREENDEAESIVKKLKKAYFEEDLTFDVILNLYTTAPKMPLDVLQAAYKRLD